MERVLRLVVCAAFILLCSGDVAFAGTSTGLPWETPLETIRQSITGPVGFVVGTVALVGAAAGIIFGGEMSELLRKLLMVVMGLGLILGGSALISMLFGVSGAIA